MIFIIPKTFPPAEINISSNHALSLNQRETLQTVHITSFFSVRLQSQNMNELPLFT